MLASFPLYWVLIIAGHREKNKSVSVNEDEGAGKNRGNDTNRLNRDTNDPNSADKVPDSADKMPDSEQERRIYEYVLENGSVTTNKVMELLNVKERRARIILQSMIEKEWLRKTGAARSTTDRVGSRCFLCLTLKLVLCAEKSCSGNRLQMDFTIELW